MPLYYDNGMKVPKTSEETKPCPLCGCDRVVITEKADQLVSVCSNRRGRISCLG